MKEALFRIAVAFILVYVCWVSTDVEASQGYPAGCNQECKEFLDKATVDSQREGYKRGWVAGYNGAMRSRELWDKAAAERLREGIEVECLRYLQRWGI